MTKEKAMALLLREYLESDDCDVCENVDGRCDRHEYRIEFAKEIMDRATGGEDGEE